MSSGTTCAVRGCHYNRNKLNDWLKLECFVHQPKTKFECSCQRWYEFHRIPKDADAKRSWLRNLNLKKPPKAVHVCSFHFVDKRPTRENPYPTLLLGERPPEESIFQRHLTGTFSLDDTSPDFAPSIFPRDIKNDWKRFTSKNERGKRKEKRDELKEREKDEATPNNAPLMEEEMKTKVADLRQTEIRLKLHAKVLSELYCRNNVIPKELRIQMPPTIGSYNKDFNKKWCDTLDKCSLDLMHLIVEELSRQHEVVSREILSQEAFMKVAFMGMPAFHDTTFESGLYEEKVTEYKRDLLDYKRSQVYSWTFAEPVNEKNEDWTPNAKRPEECSAGSHDEEDDMEYGRQLSSSEPEPEATPPPPPPRKRPSSSVPPEVRKDGVDHSPTWGRCNSRPKEIHSPVCQNICMDHNYNGWGDRTACWWPHQHASGLPTIDTVMADKVNIMMEDTVTMISHPNTNDMEPLDNEEEGEEEDEDWTPYAKRPEECSAFSKKTKKKTMRKRSINCLTYQR